MYAVRCNNNAFRLLLLCARCTESLIISSKANSSDCTVYTVCFSLLTVVCMLEHVVCFCCRSLLRQADLTYVQNYRISRATKNKGITVV